MGYRGALESFHGIKRRREQKQNTGKSKEAESYGSRSIRKFEKLIKL